MSRRDLSSANSAVLLKPAQANDAALAPFQMRYRVVPTPAELSRIAKRIFADSPLLPRSIQTLRPFICPFEEFLPWVPTGSSILDIGCGSGLFLGLLASTGAQIDGTGVDIGCAAISRGREMSLRVAADEKQPRLQFDCIEANAPLPNLCFDVVSVIDVMHHIPPIHQRSFLQQALSRVNSGGLLLYKDMCRRPRWRAASNRLHDLVMAGESIHYFPIEEVEAVAAAANFRLVASQDSTRLWYGHEFRLFQAL